jgi:hypothetical protein
LARNPLVTLLWFVEKASNVFGEDKVAGVAARGVFGEAVAEFGEGEVGEEWFAGTDRAPRDGEMEIVNQVRGSRRFGKSWGKQVAGVSGSPAVRICRKTWNFSAVTSVERG